jgi:hypothetical protein
MNDSTSSPGQPVLPQGFDVFEAWKQYQAVAMHFNDLLMRLRSQSLAAVAAFSAIAGVVLRGDVDANLRWSALSGVFLLLSLFWLAIWILDFRYYNRLLIGAVDALIEIERASKNGMRVGELVLSTRIEAIVAERTDPVAGRLGREQARWFFYTIVFLTLLGGLTYSIFRAGGVDQVLPLAGGPGTRLRPWFTVAGLSVDFVGALVLVSAAIVSKRDAINIGASRYASEKDEDNLKLPQVQDRLLQARRAKWGAALLAIGFVLQILGSWPITG